MLEYVTDSLPEHRPEPAVAERFGAERERRACARRHAAGELAIEPRAMQAGHEPVAPTRAPCDNDVGGVHRGSDQHDRSHHATTDALVAPMRRAPITITPIIFSALRGCITAILSQAGRAYSGKSTSSHGKAPTELRSRDWPCECRPRVGPCG